MRSKCSLNLACEGFCSCLLFLPQFKVSTTQGCVSERSCNNCCTSENSSCEHGATCFRVLIMCCMFTPTASLTHYLFYRLLHRLLQCVFLRLSHCGFCASLSCFTEWCMHCLCTYFSSCVAVRFIHHAFTLFTPCFDLIDSGEQCNHIINESIIASMMISWSLSIASRQYESTMVSRCEIIHHCTQMNDGLVREPAKKRAPRRAASIFAHSFSFSYKKETMRLAVGC